MYRHDSDDVSYKRRDGCRSQQQVPVDCPSQRRDGGTTREAVHLDPIARHELFNATVVDSDQYLTFRASRRTCRARSERMTPAAHVAQTMPGCVLQLTSSSLAELQHLHNTTQPCIRTGTVAALTHHCQLQLRSTLSVRIPPPQSFIQCCIELLAEAQKQHPVCKTTWSNNLRDSPSENFEGSGLSWSDLG